MKDENQELVELYFKSEMWMHDIPVNDINYWCSRCKERLGGAEKVSFTVSNVLWKPFRFEYHKECVKEALNLEISYPPTLEPD